MHVVFQKQIYLALNGSQLASSHTKLRLKYTLNGSRLSTLLLKAILNLRVKRVSNGDLLMRPLARLLDCYFPDPYII